MLIEVTYKRDKGKTTYSGEVTHGEALLSEEGCNVILRRDRETLPFSSQELETVIEKVHTLLQNAPKDVNVIMTPVPEKGLYLNLPKRGSLLPGDMVSVLRNDLEKAKELFAPTHRTVYVRARKEASNAQ